MVKIDKRKRWELRQAKGGSITPQGRNLIETEGNNWRPRDPSMETKRAGRVWGPET